MPVLLPAAGTDDQQLRVDLPTQQAECLEQQRQVLARLQRSDEQHVWPVSVGIESQACNKPRQVVARTWAEAGRRRFVDNANPRRFDTQQPHSIGRRAL